MSKDMPRLLLVEDEFLIRMTLAEILADDGFEVIEAATGAEALAQLEASSPDIVLTDLNLPGGMDGFGVARAVRQQAGGVPVLFTSGEPIDPSRLGPRDRALTKPYLPSSVGPVLREMIARATDPAG
jgi:CheY-like chemotaxis protein